MPRTQPPDLPWIERYASALSDLPAGEVIMAVLTLAITVGVGVQAWATWRMRSLSEAQANISRDMLGLQEKNLRSQEDARRPQLRVALASSSRFGDYGHEDFHGFSVTNSGLIDATVNNWWLDIGVGQSEKESSRLSKILLSPIQDGNAFPLQLPKTLRSGETAALMFEKGELISELNALFDGEEHRVRPVVIDSLGGYHTLDGWVEWTDSRTSTHREPLPGYRPSKLSDSNHHYFPL